MAAVVGEQIAASVTLLEGDTSGTVTVERYYVAPGDEVQPGDPVCMLRSERYVYDLPAEAAGVVQALLVSTGDQVEVGAPLLAVSAAQLVSEEAATLPSTNG